MDTCVSKDTLTRYVKLREESGDDSLEVSRKKRAPKSESWNCGDMCVCVCLSLSLSFSEWKDREMCDFSGISENTRKKSAASSVVIRGGCAIARFRGMCAIGLAPW